MITSYLSGDPGATLERLKCSNAEERGDELAAAVQDVRDSGAPLVIGDLAVDGNDLIAEGIEPGPKMGQVLTRLLEAALTDPSLNTKEHLLGRVRGA